MVKLKEALEIVFDHPCDVQKEVLTQVFEGPMMNRIKVAEKGIEIQCLEMEVILKCGEILSSFYMHLPCQQG